jgi:CHAT domain-containing protein
LEEEFRALTRQLASASISPEKRQTFRQRQEKLEKELYRLIPKLKPRLVQVEQVAAALPVAGALVEFQRYHLFDVSKPRKESWGEARFLALILKPDCSVTAVDLGQAAVLESAIQEARSQTIQCFADSSSPWASISELLLSPLLPHLEESRLWFFSLDGELHRIPLHILPLPNKPDQLLVDAVSLRMVSSGRDLLSELFTSERSTFPGTALVVADPAFDLKPGTSSPQEPDSVNQELRSRDMAIFQSWEPLPGTAKEGRKVAELLAAQLLTGCDATTLAVQEAKRPRILHIATHGFFLPYQPEQLQAQPWLSFDRPDVLERFSGEDPMLRSGLVLAGANHQGSDPDEDDGYLTAMEAVHLNLQGTELVTLSACDSGSGDIRTGEGVYGLQRAFIVAGARSLLLSLWPVPDDATCAFMLHFYTHLKEGFGRYDALIAVQREFRKHENIVWRHPYYWGAWQLIGDGSPTEGL